MATQTAVKGEGIRPSPSKGLCSAVGPETLFFLRGETGKDPETAKIVAPDVKGQTRQILSNITTVLKAAGGSLNDIVSATVFLKDIGDFKDFNEVWAEFFQEADPGPARTTVEVSGLGGEAVVEIQSIAYMK